MCYCEVPSLFLRSWKTARKPHQCCECRGIIQPGDRHEITEGVWDHRWDRLRTCIECVQCRDWNDAQLDRGDCPPCLGQLFEDMPEEELPDHVLAIIHSARKQRKVA